MIFGFTITSIFFTLLGIALVAVSVARFYLIQSEEKKVKIKHITLNSYGVFIGIIAFYIGVHNI